MLPGSRPLSRATRALALPCALFLGGLAGPARAQGDGGAARPSDPAFDIQLFYPSPSGHAFITTESADVNGHLEVSAGLNLNWAHKPLEVSLPDGLALGAVVENRLDVNLYGAIGLFDYVDLGFVFPLVGQGGPIGVVDNLISDGPVPSLFSTEIPGFTAGDLRLVPKFRPFTYGEGLFSVALIPTLVLPTGTGAAFASERKPLFAPTVALSTRFLERYRLALNLGYRWRNTGTQLDIVGIVVKDEIFAKLAFAARFETVGDYDIEVLAELYGHTPAQNGFGLGSPEEERDRQAARTALEGDVGARFWLAEALSINAGVGTSLAYGIGGPAVRVFAGATFYTGDIGPPDEDDDDIPDELDKCPTRAEDRDGFADDDGCPEVDNDRDRVLDEDDECPLEPEDIDRFEDLDGCPDLDNDGDNVPDADDACPNEAEDADGFADEDGCSDLDNDGDMIADAADRCPNEAEDEDAYVDYDGCPDPDNDGDGLTDLNDLCPNHAEDQDGVKDDDGCAEDNDQDGIYDDRDACPDQAETYNGVDDTDGCPESGGPRSLVKVTSESIELLAPITFARNRADLDESAAPVIAHLAAALRGHPEILEVTIAGHVPASADPEADTYLSQARADRVMDALVAAGVAIERLDPVGHGSSMPRYRNRRNDRNARIELSVAETRPLGVDVREADTGGIDFDLDLDLDLGGGAEGGEQTPPEAEPLFDGDFVVEPDAPAPEPSDETPPETAPQDESDGEVEFEFDSEDSFDFDVGAGDAAGDGAPETPPPADDDGIELNF